MSGPLVKYEAACRALADAKAVDEVKDIRDKAEAMRAYAHQAKNREMEVDAAEIRMRAERRLGELIRAQKETVGLQAGGRSRKGGGTRGAKKEPQPSAPPTLADVGIDKKLSSRAQKLAAVPEDQFEGMIGKWRERVGHENERVTTNLLRAQSLAAGRLGWGAQPLRPRSGQGREGADAEGRAVGGRMMSNMDRCTAGAVGVRSAISLLAGGVCGPEGKDRARTPLLAVIVVADLGHKGGGVFVSP